MHPERITFENRDGRTLAALLDRPIDGEPIAYALFAHCFTCSKDLKAVNDVSRSLAAEGIAVLRFDFTGIGESEGDFAQTTFSSNATDLVDAAEFMAGELQPPAILVGHSLGGAAVLRAAAQIPSATAVATIAAPSSPRHVLRAIGNKREEIERDGEAEVIIAGRPIRIARGFLDDLAEDGMRSSIESLGKALLVFHSPLDEIVGIDNATEIFVAARHPKSFVSLDSADHMLTNREDSRYAGSVIAAWAGKYLDLTQAESKAARPGGDNVIVARTEAGGFRTEILANGHPLVADEPVRVGGTNTGPSPYELLAAALGACTTMTLRMYADRKGWPLEASEVHMTHSKIHCEDCSESENPRSKVDYLVRDVVLEGALDDAQRRRLLEIADRCPVHRTLQSDIKIETALVD